MVFEGQRRAESFLSVLENIGFPKGTVKADNIDREFASKICFESLSRLTTSIKKHSLDRLEIARLQQLAGLGLLDGLLEDVDAASEEVDLNNDVRKTLAINRLLEGILDQDDVAEVEIKENLSVHTEVLSLAPLNMENADIIEACKNELHLAIDLIERKKREVFEPLKSSRYGTIPVDTLMKRPWDPAFYTEYLDLAKTAIDKLQSYGVFVELDELLHGEVWLASRRNQYQASFMKELADLESYLDGMIFLFEESCNQASKVCREQIEAIQTAWEEIIAILPSEPNKLSLPKPLLRPNQQEFFDNAAFIEPLKRIAEQVGFSRDLVKQILPEKSSELLLLPLEVLETERNLRDQCTEASAKLQQTIISSKLAQDNIIQNQFNL